MHKESFDLLNKATNSKLTFKEVEGGLGNVCMAIDEIKRDMEIVGYIKGLRKGGASLEEAIKEAANEFGETEKYVKEVYEEAA